MKQVDVTAKNEFISKFLSMMGVFRTHVDRVIAQYKAVHGLKASLTKGYVTLQMDFSENWFVCSSGRSSLCTLRRSS